MRINYKKMYDEMEKIRLEKGMSILAFCKEFNINRSTWYRWTVEGKKPTMESVLYICTKLGIEIGELFEK